MRENLRVVCCLLVGCWGRKGTGLGEGKEGSEGDMQERNRTGRQERRPGGADILVLQCHYHLMGRLGPAREWTHKEIHSGDSDLVRDL